MTREERIEKALDTLAELCDADAGEDTYQRRSAAEEILRHYRENEILKEIHVTINGAVPVRPMIKSEITYGPVGGPVL